MAGWMSREGRALLNMQTRVVSAAACGTFKHHAVQTGPQCPCIQLFPHTPTLSYPSPSTPLSPSPFPASLCPPPPCHTPHLEAGCADLLHQPLCQHLHCMRQGQAEAPTRICCPSRQHGVVGGLCALCCGLQPPTEQAPDLGRTHVRTCRYSAQPHNRLSFTQSPAPHRAQPHTNHEPRNHQLMMDTKSQPEPQ